VQDEAAYWIEKLGLIAHPEGGYFKECYRSALAVSAPEIGTAPDYSRNICTAIYFLVTADGPSHFHRLKADELWHHYAGDTLELKGIHADGRLETWLLGKDVNQYAEPQQCIPAGTWFGATVAAGGRFALCGCTMAPGFDFADFELAERPSLLAEFPQHRDLIVSLTRA
jgi:uncharacterized protein